MAYDQWGKALELTHEKLVQARASVDNKAIEVYETYLRMIMANIMPSYDNDPLLLESGQSDIPLSSPPK